MNKFLAFIFFATTVALAQNPGPSKTLTIGPKTNDNKTLKFNRNSSTPPSVRWNESASKLQFTNDGTNFSDLGSGSGSGGGGYNLITNNPDFESGIGTGWTASGGAFAAATSTPDLLYGSGSATWNPTTTGQTLRSDAYTVLDGLKSRNCLVRISYKGGDANYTLRAVDGSNTAIAGSSVVLSASTDTSTSYASFTCPSSGSMKLELASTADAASIAIDRMYLGEMDLLQQLTQAKYIGSLKYAKTTNCLWSVTQTTFAADYSADTDCPTPTVTGSVTAPGTKVPGFEVTLDPGKYFIIASGPYQSSSSNTATFALFANGVQFGSQVSNSLNAALYMSGVLDVTSTAAYSIRLRGATAASTATIDLTTLYESNLEFQVFKYPSLNETSFRPDDIAQSWSGYHDADCLWTTSSTSVITPSADASCTFTERSNQNFGTVASTGSKTPGITFTPSKTGKYFVCARASMANDGANEAKTVLTDGTNTIAGFAPRTAGGYYTAVPLCGVVTASSTSAISLTIQIGASAGNTTLAGTDSTSKSVEWSIFKLDTKFPAPVLVGAVSTDSSTGVEKLCRMKVNAPSAGTCTVVSQSGCISGTPTSPGTGQCSVVFVASTFSGTPSCVCTATSTTGARSCTTTSVSSGGFTWTIKDDTGSAGGDVVDAICMGPK